MDKSLYWLTRLCERLQQNKLPVILYVGPVGDYFYDPPFPALEIVFVISGPFKGFQVGHLRRDLATNDAVILNQHFGVQSPRCVGSNSWAMIIDVSREPLFAALAEKPLFDAFRISHPERLMTAFRNVAAWCSHVAPHSWNVMTRSADLSLSVPIGSRRSLPMHRKAALYELFAILMDEAQNCDTAPLVSKGVKDAIEFIIAHYSDPTLDLKAITQSTHLSSSHLWRILKKELGFSPMRFLRDTRLRQGAALLAQTTLRVREIADKVGFEDPLYFSRMFRATFKCSPLTYRKRMNMSL